MHFAVYEARFWSYIDWLAFQEMSDCWVWTGAKSRGGYGQFRINKEVVATHRLAYELLIGPIPDGLQLDHLCRNPSCVNPGHLEPVTMAENIRRIPTEVRQRVAEAQRRTHCPEGHERISTGARWRCPICQRKRSEERYRALKEEAAALGMTVAEWRIARRGAV